MLTLYILRHGKSDWNAEYTQDRDRPLAPRGRKAAAAIGRFLADRNANPQVLVTSPALRAQTTLRLVAEAAGWSTPQIVDDRLYGATPAGVLQVVKENQGDAESLLVCGHEPWCSDLVEFLSGSTPRFPTATVACFAVDRLKSGGGTLEWLQRPKDLES